jgi:large subunit ribosomal protein L1
MSTKGKRYLDALKRFDREQLHTPAESVDLVKSLAGAKFDETVELAIRLGVDPRRAEQAVRGSLSLPEGTGKVLRGRRTGGRGARGGC